MQHIFVRVTVLKEKLSKEALLHLESTELRRAGHLSDISSKGVVLSERNDVEMSRANSLHALVKYCKYNKRFDLHLESRQIH